MLKSDRYDDNNPNSTLSEPLVSNPNNTITTDSSTNANPDRSIINRLLNYKQNEQATDDQNEKNVCVDWR